MAPPVKLKFLVEDRDRHGNVRVYVKMNGVGKIRIHERPRTAEFYTAYSAALQTLTDRREGKTPAAIPSARQRQAQPGTLAWLIDRYCASAEFRKLAQSTQTVRRGILDKIHARPAGGKPYAKMEARHVAILRDEKADTPEAANSVVKTLRQVFKWAMLEHVNLAKNNPAAGCRYFDSNPEGFHSWTIQEVEAYEERHPIGTKARLALALLLYTGVRRGDVVKLGPQHLHTTVGEDGTPRRSLTFQVSKGRSRKVKSLTLPVLPELEVVLEATPSGHMAFLVTEFGKPYTHGGFGNWFNRRCREAGLENCSAHGLRKAGAALAAEGGATANELMAVYGWDTLKEAERYTRAARQKILASQGAGAITRGRMGNIEVPPLSVVASGGTKKGKKS